MTRREPRLALIYQTEALHQHLRSALTELGAKVVYETPAHAYEQAAFEREDPEVVVINLEGGDDFAPLDELLADDRRRVIFDDGEVSSRLQGWDLARWTRHLAAKVLDVADVHPPRPEGAIAVPVRVKAGPGRMNEPRTGADFEIQGAELEHALAADTGAAIELTRAELVTEQDPVWAELEPGAYENPEWNLEIADAELGQGTPERAAGGNEPTVELEFSTDGLAGLGDAAEKRGDETLEIDFDPALLQDFDRGASTPPRADAPTLELEFESDTVAFRELAPDETHRWSVVEEPVAEAPAGSYIDDAFKALGFIDIDAEVPPPRSAEGVVDLETLLQQASELEQERSRGSIGKSAEALAAARASDMAAANSAARASEAARAAAVTAARPAIAPDPEPGPALVQPPPKPKRSLQDFEAALAGLSLAPIDDPAAPPAVAPPVEPRAGDVEKRTADFGGSFGTLSLEPIEGEEPARPAPGRASFNLPVQPQAAKAPAPAPVSHAPARASAVPTSDDGLSLEGFEFSFDPTPRPSGRPATSPDEDLSVDLDTEIESLLAREASTPAPQASPALAIPSPSASPLERVWVLGASIGGPDAVREFLGALPAGFPALFLLAQHVGADFLELMVVQLTKAVRLRVRNASHGDVLAHGEVVVVPLADRLLVGEDGTMQVVASEGTSSYSPSIDQALRDVADRFGAKAGAIIFSGMARDAIDGAKYLKSRGGRVWVQDPSTCVISSMVDGAREAGIVEFSGSPQQLAQKFIAEFGTGSGTASGSTSIGNQRT